MALQPTEYDPDSGRLYAFQLLSLQFQGSADLDVKELSANETILPASTDPASFGGMLMKSGTPAATPTAEYLIVTGEDFVNSLEPLAQWKRLRGISTEIVPLESILAESPGIDAAEQLRNYLIEAYQGGTRYVLLAGDETVLPIRYAYHGNTNTQPGLDMEQVCDLYFADVDGDWDSDSDGVYGEPSQDDPDITPDLLVGRLPFSQPEEFQSYVDKLIQYEKNPGKGDYDWLNRSLFISADQMRDYQDVGQHTLVAEALPSYVTPDMTGLVEDPSGDAVDPDAPFATDALSIMDEGWGTTSLLIHGMHDGWVIRSSQYNEWPKSFLLTADGVDGTHGHLPNLTPNDKPGLVYSIGCNNAAFDMDQPPFPSTTPSVVESFLQMPAGGAVAFIGYTRWGWVTLSWKIEKAFFEELYGGVPNPCEALRQAKAQFPYYRDMQYGLNYYGDPTLDIWTDLPQDLQVEFEQFKDTGMVDIQLHTLDNGNPVADATLHVLENDSIIVSTATDGDGAAAAEINFNTVDTFTVVAVKDGHVAASAQLSPSITLDVGDDNGASLPLSFALSQNYPNPFNPTTTISFTTRAAEIANLTVYNILGQEVVTLADKRFEPGRHEVAWDGRDSRGRAVSSGIYFARLRQGTETAIIKMTLLK